MQLALPIMAASTIAGGVSKAFGTSEQAGAMRQQMLMNKVAEANRNTQRIQQTTKVIGDNAVAESARGVALSSPSFSALSQNNIDSMQQDEQADALNTSWKNNAVQARIDSLDTEKYANVFGTISSLAMRWNKL